MRFWLWLDLVSITHAISWAKISNYDIIIEQLIIQDLARYFTTTLHCRDIDILSDSSPLRCWLCLCRGDVEEKDRELCLLWLVVDCSVCWSSVMGIGQSTVVRDTIHFLLLASGH